MDVIQVIYSLFERSNLSLTGLTVVVLLFALSFVFSAREALVWFLKIDDVRREVIRVGDSVTLLETEIRSLQTVIGKTRHNLFQPPVQTSIFSVEEKSVHTKNPMPNPSEIPTPSENTSPGPRAPGLGFSIIH